MKSTENSFVISENYGRIKGLVLQISRLIGYIPKQPPEVFCRKNVPRNFAKFTGMHLCQSLFFSKVAGLRL